jgi:hypothetical protein
MLAGLLFAHVITTGELVAVDAPATAATEALAASAGALLVIVRVATPLEFVRTTDEPVEPETGETSPFAAPVQVVVNVTG